MATLPCMHHLRSCTVNVQPSELIQLLLLCSCESVMQIIPPGFDSPVVLELLTIVLVWIKSYGMMTADGSVAMKLFLQLAYVDLIVDSQSRACWLV